MSRTIIRTEHAPAPIGPYSQGVLAGGSLLFTAGQIPLDPKTGELVAGDIRAQTRQALDNLRAILEKAGTSVEAVVKTTVYLSDMGEFAAMNEVYAEVFGKSAPARTTVEASRLPRDVKVEIDAVAVVDR